MTNLSINVLMDSYINPEAAQRSLFPYLDRAPLSLIQLTAGARKEQAVAFANRLKARYPQMDIILRIMPDENPPTWKRYIPMAWVDAYAPFSNNGEFILSMANEAGVGVDLVAQNLWYTQAIELAGKRGIRVTTPNIATHNTFDPAAFDSTYRMLAKYNGKFSVHYYFHNEEGKPIQPVLEAVETYCMVRNIHVGRLVTELGYAYQLGAYTGYQGHLSGKTYAQQLMNAASRWPDLTFCVFAWGKQSPFESFDISQDTDLQAELVKYNLTAQHPTPAPVPHPTPTPTDTVTITQAQYAEYQALLAWVKAMPKVG